MIFCLAFTMRLALVAVEPVASLATKHEAIRIAESIAAGKGFSNPYSCPTGPTAHLAPGYPLLLAGVFRAFATMLGRGVVLGIIASTATSLAWALMPLLALRLGVPLSAGVVAGLFGAVFPMLPGLESRGAWESSLTTLLVVACTLLTIRFTRSPGWRQALWAGVAWGASFWFGPNLLPICVVWVACCLPKPDLRMKSCTMFAVSMLVISPWIFRNWLEFGHVFWVRDTLGLELRVANNPAAIAVLDNVAPSDPASNPFTNLAATKSPPATNDLDQTQAWQRRIVAYDFHPAANPLVCAKVQVMGEYPYMQMQGNNTVTWILANPWDFLRITGQHIWYFWLPALPLFRRILAGGCGLLGLIGLVISWRYGWRARAALIGGLLVYPLVYYLVQAISRYRQPVQPLIVLSAAIVLELLWRRLLARRSGAETAS